MHVFFSGIGGAGIGPLALIAKQAGYIVSGSDKQPSSYIDSLRAEGVEVMVGEDVEKLAEIHEKLPINWMVYSSALPKENPNHPFIKFAKANNIPSTKRDLFINKLLKDTNQQMLAVAGTHGKTTTTAMLVWMFKQLKLPISYSVGAKLSFGAAGEFNKDAKYFIYEADEYDRNFLSFNPLLSIIPGIAYDHPDVYPTQEDYNQAFLQFFKQSREVIAHPEDVRKLTTTLENGVLDQLDVLYEITLAGEVNRKNAQLVIEACYRLKLADKDKLVNLVNQFPGVSRRFEKLVKNVYTDYAHTPEKIEGALQLAHEVARDNVVVVYEGLHNTRQHFIREQLKTLFSSVKKLYIVPSYLAREDESLEMLTPEKLCDITAGTTDCSPAKLNDNLKNKIEMHAQAGDTVLCLTAGGGGSLDEWLRKEIST